VVNLTLPIAIPDGPNRMYRPLPPPFDPLVLPEDLSRRISVLHGDPAVWWIGQFVNFIMRHQLSTHDILEEYEDNMGFEGPTVGYILSIIILYTSPLCQSQILYVQYTF